MLTDLPPRRTTRCWSPRCCRPGRLGSNVWVHDSTGRAVSTAVPYSPSGSPRRTGARVTLVAKTCFIPTSPAIASASSIRWLRNRCLSTSWSSTTSGSAAAISPATCSSWRPSWPMALWMLKVTTVSDLGVPERRHGVIVLPGSTDTDAVATGVVEGEGDVAPGALVDGVPARGVDAVVDVDAVEGSVEAEVPSGSRVPAH